MIIKNPALYLSRQFSKPNEYSPTSFFFILLGHFWSGFSDSLDSFYSPSPPNWKANSQVYLHCFLLNKTMLFSCFLFQFFLCLGCAQDIHTYSVQYPSHMKMTVTESVILFVLDYCSLPVQQWTVPSPHQVTCLPVGTCASRILWGPFSSILSRKVCCVF